MTRPFDSLISFAVPRGLRCLVVEKNGKGAIQKNWPNTASSKPADLHKAFKGRMDANYGVLTTGHYVIDIDPRNGGDETFKNWLDYWEVFHGPLPRTLTVRTPGGGRHYYFSTRRKVQKKTGGLGPGVDVQADSAYVVGPGSIIDGRSYEIEIDSPIAALPDWLYEHLDVATPKLAATDRALDPPATIRPQAAKARAAAVIAAAPVVAQGYRNDAAYHLICQARDEGVDRETARALIHDLWNARLPSPMDGAELDATTDSVYEHAQTPRPGTRAPEEMFAAISPEAAAALPTWPNDDPPWLAEMNALYAVTTHQGKTMIHELVQDPELGHVRHQWITFDDFRRRHMARRVAAPRGKTVDIGTAWLEHPRRRQFAGEAFLPGQKAPANTLNLWRGFAVEPVPGTWARLQNHIRDIICDGDEALYVYVIGWLASLIQRPGRPGQVALVLQGGEGTGKGSFSKALLKLTGQHGLQIAQAKHLTGAFNAHMQAKILVFVDEAFFAGNPEHRGPLYSLITEDRLQIEAKGVDAKTTRNVLHVIMATNEDWAIPAGVNARRFCVLKVSERHRQDTAYFRALHEEMDTGGLAAMLHDLQAHDLSDFNPYAAPSTAALAEQKLMSLKGTEAWLLDCLQRGTIGATDFTRDGLSIQKTDTHSLYRHQSKDYREIVPRDMATWSRILRNVLGSAVQERKLWTGGKRTRQLVLSPLADCRQAFERHIKQKIEWETDALAPAKAMPHA